MVDRDNSPFNIVRELETDDLTLDAARALATIIWGEQDDEAADAAYQEVGGQPYLLQYLYDLACFPGEGGRSETINRALDELRVAGNDHLRDLFR